LLFVRLASHDTANHTNLVVQFLQKVLGGEIHVNGILRSPGRGCSLQDRSLMIETDPTADFGFKASQSRIRDSDPLVEAWIVSEVETYFDGIEPLIKSSKQFVADFTPPDYLVDGMLQEGFLYSLTGATGAGKTAITLRLAASCALGIPFAGRETKKTRVLYLAAENSADVRMRWIATAQQMDFEGRLHRGVLRRPRVPYVRRDGIPQGRGRNARRTIRPHRHRHRSGVL
jgi:hypothetical protein